MNIYEEREFFNRYTGKSMGMESIQTDSLCDYCGKKIDENNMEVSFSIKEVGGSEETYYYYVGEDYGISSDKNVDIHKIFDVHRDYEYCNDEDGISCSNQMLEYAERDCFDNLDNLETVMQKSRLHMVAKLLDEGMTAKQLGIEASD